MILQRLRMIVVGAGFEPGTFATGGSGTVFTTTSKLKTAPPHTKQFKTKGQNTAAKGRVLKKFSFFTVNRGLGFILYYLYSITV